MLKPSGTEEPITRIVLVLAASVGAPFFILSATGPLLQGWFSRTHQSRSPYRLYALSNVGSLLALISFPIVFEWLLPARLLAWIWSISFIAFAILCGVCAWAFAAHGRTAVSTSPDTTAEADVPPSWGTWLLWFCLAMVPSVLLLATTNQVCLDVATVPFLWVLPLTLYLLSFILCFDSDRWYSRRYFIPACFVAMACVCYVLEQGAGARFSLQFAAYFTALFFCAMVCHGELVRRKPHVRHLTSFYLVISAGGAAGGIFVGIIAPHWFTGYYELHLGLFACGLLILIVLGLDRRQLPFSGLWKLVWLVLPLAVGSLGASLVVNATRQGKNLINVSRNFYGVLRVKDGEDEYGSNDDDLRDEPTRELLNGRIQHGFQFLNPELKKVATSYYGVTSGVGRALSLPSDGPRRVGLVGLGTGTLATYARSGDHFQFYEINSKVEELGAHVLHVPVGLQGRGRSHSRRCAAQPESRAAAELQRAGTRCVLWRRDSGPSAHARGVRHLPAAHGSRRASSPFTSRTGTLRSSRSCWRSPTFTNCRRSRSKRGESTTARVPARGCSFQHRPGHSSRNGFTTRELRSRAISACFGPTTTPPSSRSGWPISTTWFARGEADWRSLVPGGVEVPDRPSGDSARNSMTAHCEFRGRKKETGHCGRVPRLALTTNCHQVECASSRRRPTSYFEKSSPGS